MASYMTGFEESSVSASQISQMMLVEAEKLAVPTDGIKSFDRKITKCFELLNEEKTI